jgi:uncharacterized protein (TIGR02996 family)
LFPGSGWLSAPERNVNEGDAIVRAILVAPEDTTARLVYADWLQEREHPGAEYLRAEAALFRAPTDAARRRLLERIPPLPADWRQRFEQPDLLLAPPTPFPLGWWPPNTAAPKPYRSLSNLDPAALSVDMPCLSAEGVRARVDQAEHEREELVALAQIRTRAKRLRLILPSGFQSFAHDFPRRLAVSRTGSYFRVCLADAVVDDFPSIGEGYLVVFCGMDYGSRPSLTWSLYLVPGIDWHCVVVSELPDNTDALIPDDPERIFYCAPSFQALLHRWWLGPQGRKGETDRPRRRT